MTAWHEDERFWKMFGSAMFTQERMAAAEWDVDGILEIAPTPPQGRVLDMFCGPGRHVLEFARRGFEVTGVDRTQAYLDQAAASAAEENLQVELIQADGRRFIRRNTYDLAVNLYTSFGYFENPQEDVQMARALYESLKPGGKLVIEMIGKEVIARDFRARSWRQFSDFMMLEERRLRDDFGWLESRWIIIKDGAQREITIGHRIYSATEIKSLLLSCGFARTSAYDGLSGEPYDHRAIRLAVVAEKEY